MLDNATLKASLPNPLIEDRRDIRNYGQIKLTEPNRWFAEKFPDQTLVFGSAFLEAKRNTVHEDIYIPLHPNDDLLASILGGSKHLGYQVVYFPPEDSFYFFDYQVDAFSPVSEAKLKLLLSNYMIRCAQDSRSYVHVLNLVVAYRKDDALNRIITKAKAILEAENSFFYGKIGKRRYIDGKYIEPAAEPSHRLFVKKEIVRDPDSTLTISNAFSRYHSFCQQNCLPPLARTDFKDLVREVIREEFNLGLRHDIRSETGKVTHGWDGLTCLEPVMGLN